MVTVCVLQREGRTGKGYRGEGRERKKVMSRRDAASVTVKRKV